MSPDALDTKTCSVYHWEQRKGYATSDSITLYTLGAMEKGRHLVSLHKLYDDCCYRGCGKHDAMRAVRDMVNNNTLGRYEVVFTPHHRHEVSVLDKQVIRDLLLKGTTQYII